MDLKKWKDLPATFRDTQSQELTTKNNKKWSYLVNVAHSTIFLDFLSRFDAFLASSRIHVVDGFWQDQTFSQMWEDGSKVITTFSIFTLCYLTFYSVNLSQGTPFVKFGREKILF